MKNMKVMSVCWGVMLVCIFGALTVFGYVYTKKVSVYKELESILVEAEKKYADAKFVYPDKDTVVKTKLSELGEYLDSNSFSDLNCTGYATLKYNGTVYEYKGYVSCNNYKTKGYEE